MGFALQVAESIEVEERFLTADSGSRVREYRVRMRFVHPDAYPPEAELSFQQVPDLAPYAALPLLPCHQAGLRLRLGFHKTCECIHP